MAKDTREPKEILVHITAARVALTSVIYGLSEADLLKEGPVGRWSVKDAMAHIGRWEEVCRQELELHVRGEPASGKYNDFLAYNAAWEAELHALSLQEAIALFETAHYRLFALLSALNPEQWSSYVRAWVTGSTWHHFEEHAGQIRAWRAALV
ncbi:MAG: maleylpyruvate isomerase N-terminal domain-containing protein [Ktedonobacteraceae bacterium]|nr:ClbS/DfsB family four-helix bundle protein [Chloroflexota bacterium]